MKIWILFAVFGYEFFSISLFLPGHKLRCDFENTSIGTCGSVIPRLREQREAQLSLNFRYVATHFSPKNKAHFFHLGLNQNRFTCKRVLLWKTDGSHVVGHNPHSPKILKNVIIIDTSHCPKWIFSATSGLSSSIKMSSESPTTVEEDSIDKPMLFIHSLKSW